MEAPIVLGHRLAQGGDSLHRRILVGAAHQGLGRLGPHVLWTGVVGKALAQVDGAVLGRQTRHHREDGGRQAGEHWVEASIHERPCPGASLPKTWPLHRINLVGRIQKPLLPPPV